jgi:hypothetical protein
LKKFIFFPDSAAHPVSTLISAQCQNMANYQSIHGKRQKRYY